MYRLENVSFAYPQNQLNLPNNKTKEPSPCLSKLNLEISPGERWVIIGPSGCGKSTLLLLLAGLLKPTQGQIWLENGILENPHPEISLILQDYGLFPWKTVSENAALGLIISGLKQAKAQEIVLPILTILGLNEHLYKYPAQLSGGQRQRVAIARSLATEPRYLLLDEPFSALDTLTREQLQDSLLNLASKYNFTMVMVTHNIEEAVYLGQKIVILSSSGEVLHLLENTGQKPDRNTPEYYGQCAKIRFLLEGGRE